MQLGDPLSVTTPSDTQIVITRGFVAPPHLVYACYTQPSLIRRWLTGPDGWTMPVCTYDARVGGMYRFEWHGPENAFLALSGQISRIDAIRYIDFTHVSYRDTEVVIRELRPAAFIKGKDWEGRLPAPQVDVCRELGIPVLYLDTIRGSSSHLLHTFRDSGQIGSALDPGSARAGATDRR